MASASHSVEIDLAFRRAEEAYARLRAEYDAGSLSADQFKAAVEAERIDYGGRWWMLGVNSGRWYAYDGTAWREADPPVRAPIHAPAAAPASGPPEKSKGMPEWLIALIATLIAALARTSRPFP